jgi:hypothetical protein
MRLLLSNNKQVENNVNKDKMETWGNQQSVIHTGGKALPVDKYCSWGQNWGKTKIGQ